MLLRQTWPCTNPGKALAEFPEEETSVLQFRSQRIKWEKGVVWWDENRKKSEHILKQGQVSRIRNLDFIINAEGSQGKILRE